LCRQLGDIFGLHGRFSVVLLFLIIILPMTPAIGSGAPRKFDIPICVGKLEFFLVPFRTGASSQGGNFLEIFLGVVGDNCSAISLARQRAAIHNGRQQFKILPSFWIIIENTSWHFVIIN
jgi:hypothetical protein